ncbi:MAG: (deoxy)nucleoside triphosphate pyrophosphohydrolase [Acidobacteriota bacterium]
MPADESRTIVVLAAVIERDGQLLVSQRLEGSHLQHLWEFPGGKLEAHESHEQCLARELMEELGVLSTIGAEILVTEHHYAERTVRLHFRECEIVGEPLPVLGQQLQWVTRAGLDALQFPDADRDLIEQLKRSGS